MAEKHRGEGAARRGTLALMAEICASADRAVAEAARRGETLSLGEAFAEAISSVTSSEKELVTLWAAFMLGARAAEALHDELVLMEDPLPWTELLPSYNPPTN